eukprot:jgi/Tetstr1/458673/TSEL_045063.t1
MGVVDVLANLTSRSPLLMTELRKLWFILDSNDISVRAHYIKTTANTWADRFISREIDYGDWAFSLRHYNQLDNIWGRHTIDCFATMENATLLQRARPPTACASPMAHGVPDRGWHQRLSEMASEVVVFPPSPDLFAPGRLGVRTGVGLPKWQVVAFRLPLRTRCPAPGS